MGLCTHSSVRKSCLVHRGECVTTGGLYRPTHLCVAHLNCTKKKFTVFSFSMFQEVGVCMGFQRGAG